ncbi:hypothetical protein HMPREF9413_6092 [Paenibacillus sp. HGF7]|nr:hypothetical protein HMPREF9413_6092 [Paenibacillus sp. HGF7]
MSVFVQPIQGNVTFGTRPPPPRQKKSSSPGAIAWISNARCLREHPYRVYVLAEPS